MKERPILFSTAMVQAILEGRKTHTRRIVNPQPEGKTLQSNLDGKWLSKKFNGLLLPKIEDLQIHCPYGQVGDRLWVRETWSTHACFDDISPKYITTCSIHYWADNKVKTGKKRASIHMPRLASRILLEITDVRIERLKDISKEDAKAEGFDYSTHPSAIEMGFAIGAKTNFRHAWQKIHGADSWNENPWVWVIEFRVVGGDK